jgi:hypothetical protein
MRQNSAYRRGQRERRCDQAPCGYSAAHGQSQIFCASKAAMNDLPTALHHLLKIDEENRGNR